jgi:hypothetical protein
MTRWNGSYLGTLKNTSLQDSGGIWNLKRQTLAKQLSTWPLDNSVIPIPSWTLDFSSGTPSGYTLTRSGTGATFINSSGYIEAAGENVARLTHDSSGNRLGLLVEESRTQYARDTNNWNATLTNNSGTTRTVNYATAPNNQTEATRVEITSSGFIYKGSSGSVAAGTYTFSVWIKATSSGQSVCIRRIFGGSSSVTTVTTSTAWTRYSYQETLSSSGAVEIGVDQRTVVGGPGSSCDILMWGAMIENGADVTSYIVNTSTTTSVTRSADLAHILDENITSWGTPGALVIHFYQPGQAGTLISTDDATNQQLGIKANTTTTASAFWSNGETSTGNIGTIGIQKAVHYWDGTTSKFCINGGSVVSGTNNITTFSNIDYITLGAEATSSTSGYSQYANCIIKKVEFYPGELDNQKLQLITNNTYNIEYLVIAGGGGGGGVAQYGGASGGGGAGGYKTSTGLSLTVGNVVTVTVGGGGAGGAGNASGSAGTNSSISGTGISTITSAGGGFGARGVGGTTGLAGGSGGSGGGGGYGVPAGGAGSGTSGEGNNGAAGWSGSPFHAGGGGGAGGAAVTLTNTQPGNGGAASSSSISGSSLNYAGGGGGGAGTTVAAGTAGSQGGNGGAVNNSGDNATANRGGGGGGAGDRNAAGTSNGGNGGSGVVILRMATANYSGIRTGNPTVTTDGEFTILTFNGSGSYTA